MSTRCSSTSPQTHSRLAMGTCHIDTDPDPGSEKLRYGSGSRPNFDTGPDPRKTIRIRVRIRIQAKKDSERGKSYKFNLKKRSYPMFCVL